MLPHWYKQKFLQVGMARGNRENKNITYTEKHLQTQNKNYKCQVSTHHSRQFLAIKTPRWANWNCCSFVKHFSTLRSRDRKARLNIGHTASKKGQGNGQIVIQHTNLNCVIQASNTKAIQFGQKQLVFLLPKLTVPCKLQMMDQFQRTSKL